MPEIIIKATLKDAVSLLLRWFKERGDTKQLDIDTINFLKSVGALQDSNLSTTQSKLDSEGRYGPSK